MAWQDRYPNAAATEEGVHGRDQGSGVGDGVVETGRGEGISPFMSDVPTTVHFVRNRTAQAGQQSA